MKYSAKSVRQWRFRRKCACGKVFLPTAPTQVNCSDACGNRRRVRKHKEKVKKELAQLRKLRALTGIREAL